MGCAFSVQSGSSKPDTFADLFDNEAAEVDIYLKKQQEQKIWTAWVTSVSMCKSPMQHQPLWGWLPTVHHHFLIVEVTVDVLPSSRPEGQDLNNRHLMIRAEKLAVDKKGGYKGTIGVKYAPIILESDYEIFHKVDDIGLSVPITLLVHILLKHCPDYDVLKDNCWTYTNATLRTLLTTFGDVYPEERTRMYSHLQAIPPLLMPITIAEQMTKSAVVDPISKVVSSLDRLFIL